MGIAEMREQKTVLKSAVYKYHIIIKNTIFRNNKTLFAENNRDL